MEFKNVIETVGYAVEGFGVFIIVLGSVVSMVRFSMNLPSVSVSNAYVDARRDLGRSIILGLEWLIAGDIIRTVVVAATLENVAVLALIILVRSFLGFTLHWEVEGYWPWQRPEARPPK